MWLHQCQVSSRLQPFHFNSHFNVFVLVRLSIQIPVLPVQCSPVEFDGADGQTAAEHVHHLHGQIQTAGRLVETNTQVC